MRRGLKIQKNDPGFWLEVTIDEGKHHQVRRMMERVGYPVKRLVRVKMGNLSLLSLNDESFHVLSATEIEQLKEYLNLIESQPTLPAEYNE